MKTTNAPRTCTRASFFRIFRLGGCAAVGLGAFAPSVLAQWTVVDLHPVGATGSSAAAGRAGFEAGNVFTGAVTHAALWSGTGASFVDMNPAGASSSECLGVDGASGQQVGVATFGGLTCAGVWGGSAGSWTNLNPNPNGSYAFGTQGGHQVGFYALSSGFLHAALWSGSAGSLVDLAPPGTFDSVAWAVYGNKQAGQVRDGVFGTHACMWSGSAGTIVDLMPAGSGQSQAFGMDGAQQVGRTLFASIAHASLWSGTAASFVDLHPAVCASSQANAVDGGQQVGYGNRPFGYNHALLWSGTAGSVVDLHLLLPPPYNAFDASSTASGIWHEGAVTFVAGTASNPQTGQSHAFLWRNGPPPCPADVGVAGGLPGHDGVLDNNDFIAFIEYFFTVNPVADRGVAGGVAGSDGQFDNNDFIVFIGQFFDGCG